MLKTSLVENGMKLEEPQIQLLLEETFAQVDTNKDGVIDMAEYQVFVRSNPKIISHMNVDVAQKVERLKAQIPEEGDAPPAE